MTGTERAAFREKIASIGFARSQPAQREYRREDGVRVKEVTDTAGNITTYWNTGDTERVGVEIRPKTITVPQGVNDDLD